MSPYNKVAQAVIRLVAFGLAVTTFFLYADDFYLFLSHKAPHRKSVLILKAVPLLLGLALLCTGRSLARRLTKDLD